MHEQTATDEERQIHMPNTQSWKAMRSVYANLVEDASVGVVATGFALRTSRTHHYQALKGQAHRPGQRRRLGNTPGYTG